ncbi:3 saliva-related transmembrane conserved region [Chrysochromulina tobinii]|uniref:3 saliva-related transmembrane conserved region n=1 Tax=Chrysochromulina tobinii TaxID=1460289 RepID=A0A0M0JG98_9EUKA|nr:3 saliva-related transmembrane conserved region [Chrysochromulina tobinii]|eukprot:KOO25604.1 3 saliva-related transmembrane conserved region [Chrysochromulina sp. CCMP291]
MGKYTSYGECSSTIGDLSSAVDDEDTTQAGVGVAIQNPQPAVAFIESVGSLAGICTTAAFLPQVWAVHITGDTSGLSRPMYCIFVFGVFLWIMYGFLKHAGSLVTANLITFVLAGYILTAIVVNTFFHSQKEQEIEDVLLDTANDALKLLPMVAVCAAGPAHTFTHPQIKKGLEEMLLQPGWDLFAALDVEAVYSELEDAKLHASLVAPSRVQAALSSLSAVDAVLFDASWASVATGECSLLDTAPKALAASVTSLAFGVQQCYEMVLRAERRRNVSYTHVAWVLLELAGFREGQEAALLARMSLPDKRVWLSRRLYRHHHGGKLSEEDPILFVEATRDEPARVLHQIRAQYDAGVGLGGDLSATLEVNFKDENSAGSAVRREWFALVSEAFVAPSAGLLIGTERGASVRPLPMLATDPRLPQQLRDLEMLGRFLGLAIIQQVCVGVRLHPSLCRSLLAHGQRWEWTYEDVEQLDAQLYQHKVNSCLVVRHSR